MFCAMDLLNATACNSTLMNLQSAKDNVSGTRLQHRCQREQEGRRSEGTELRQARLDRRHVHSEESDAFSRSIGVELDSEGSIMSTRIEH